MSQTSRPGRSTAARRRPATASPGPAAVDPLEGHDAWTSPGFLLWHATLRWQREVASTLRPLGLTHAQFVLLGSAWWLTSHGAPPSQRQVAEHAGTDPMMTSQVVRTLAGRGLLTRAADPLDGRVVRVEVTAAGQRLARRAVTAMDRLDRELFADVTLEPVLRTLRHLARRAPDGSSLEP